MRGYCRKLRGRGGVLHLLHQQENAVQEYQRWHPLRQRTTLATAWPVKYLLGRIHALLPTVRRSASRDIYHQPSLKRNAWKVPSRSFQPSLLLLLLLLLLLPPVMKVTVLLMTKRMKMRL